MNKYDPNYIPEKRSLLSAKKLSFQTVQGIFYFFRRSEKSSNGGKWSLAGGALENNEAPIEGLKREIQEETQLVVSDIKPFSILNYKDKDNDQVLILGYTCEALHTSVKLNWEHDQFKWVTSEEALQMNLGDHARFFIENLER